MGGSLGLWLLNFLQIKGFVMPENLQKEIEHLKNFIKSLHKEIRDQREEIAELKRINKVLSGKEEPPEINSRAWIV